jgi:hypothetical protein
MSDIRGQFISAAIGWAGTPFGEQGRTKGQRADCVGLVLGAAKEVGYVPEDWDFTAYGINDNQEAALKWLAKWCDQIPVKEIAPGDIAVLNIGNGLAAHMGIVYNHVDGLGLIHADQRVGRVVMHRMDAGYFAKMLTGFRLKK